MDISAQFRTMLQTNKPVATFLTSQANLDTAYQTGNLILRDILDGHFKIDKVFPDLYEILELYNCIRCTNCTDQTTETCRSRLEDKLLAFENTLPSPVPEFPFTMAPEKADIAKIGLALILTDLKTPLFEGSESDKLTRRVQMAITLSAFNSLVHPIATIQSTVIDSDEPFRPFHEEVGALHNAMIRFRSLVPDILQFYKAAICISVKDKTDTLSAIQTLRNLITSIEVYSSGDG